MFTFIAFLGIILTVILQLLLPKISIMDKRYNNKINVLFALSIVFFAGYLFYPHFKNLTKPTSNAWTKKESPVSQKDIKILKRASKFLSDESSWDKNYDRYCLIWVKKSLFCAIALAQKEVDGKYIHGSTSIQNIRFIIDDKYPERWKYHPIMEFNNHPKTTFTEVQQLLADAIVRIKDKLEAQRE